MFSRRSLTFSPSVQALFLQTESYLQQQKLTLKWLNYPFRGEVTDLRAAWSKDCRIHRVWVTWWRTSIVLWSVLSLFYGTVHLIYSRDKNTTRSRHDDAQRSPCHFHHLRPWGEADKVEVRQVLGVTLDKNSLRYEAWPSPAEGNNFHLPSSLAFLF